MATKIINNAELPDLAVDHSTHTIPNTVMPGKIRQKVQELNKLDKKAEAEELAKQFSFKIQIDMGRVPMDKVYRMAAESLIVPLQNGLIRPLGADKIKKIASGESVECDKELGIHANKGVVKVHANTWITRPRAKGNAKPQAEKIADQMEKLSDDEQILVIAKRIMAKKGITLEEATEQAKALLG